MLGDDSALGHPAQTPLKIPCCRKSLVKTWSAKVPTAVAHNCHGKTKSHGKTNFTHGKTKLTHGETKLTHGKTINSRQNKINSRQDEENELQRLISGCYLHLKWYVV